MPALSVFEGDFGKGVAISFKMIYLCKKEIANFVMLTQNTKQNIIPVISKYFSTQPVKKAWLFGSFARGEENSESDIDMLVQLDYSQKIGLRYFGMIEDLKELLGRNVDLVSERYLMPFAQESADKDKVIIYERSE